MRHPGLASTRLRFGLAAVIVVNLTVGAANLHTGTHHSSPEVAMAFSGTVELPAAAPRPTPIAQDVVSGGAAPAPVHAVAVRKEKAAPAPRPAPVTGAPGAPRSNVAALHQWRAALADRANHPADVVVVGDSITEGYFVSDADRWITALRDDLRASNPAGVAGGEGFIPAWHVGRALDHTVPAWTQRWNVNGFPQDWTDSGFGLGRRALVFTDARQSASITVTADRIWLAYTEGPDEGLMRITVDNKLPVVVDTKAKGARSGRVWDSGALPAGSHTVTVAAVPGSKIVLDGIMPFRGDGGPGGDMGRGVRVWDGGHTKYTSSEFADGTPYWSQGFDTISPDLVIIEIGTNDQYFGHAPDQLRANVTRIVDGIRQQATATGRPVPSIAIMPVWARGDGAVTEWERYRAALLAVADDRGCAVLDAFGELHQAPAQPTPTGLFLDVVHPNVAGHRWLGDTVNRLLAA